MMKNDIVEDINGYKHTLTKEINRGGQGAVYRTQNPNIAVKLVFDREDMAYSKNVSENKKFDFLRTLPLPENIEITLPQVTLRQYVGYTMTLLDEMESFEDAFAYKFDFDSEYTNAWLESIRKENEECARDFTQYIVSGGLRRRIEAYFKSAVVLSMLHASGLVYCDLSANNLFISTEDTNAVWLIDADNINFQSYTVKNGGYYTPGYAAPEILWGKGSTFYSDCYSFAVSFFWNLTWNHPFVGALLDEGFDDDFADDSQDRAYSGEFPWIYDVEDDSNHPGDESKGMPADYVISPRLMKYFNRTFSAEGKKKKSTRTTMFEWCEVLAETLDHIIRCPKCGMDYYFYSSCSCPWCDADPIVITLTSYKNGIKVWEYCHELTESSEVAIPLRILEGVNGSNVNKTAFYMKQKEDGIVIYDMNDEYDFKINVNKRGFTSAYGEVSIPKKCEIMAESIKKRSAVNIEVVIK